MFDTKSMVIEKTSIVFNLSTIIIQERFKAFRVCDTTNGTDTFTLKGRQFQSFFSIHLLQVMWSMCAFNYFCIPAVSRSVALREGYNWSIAERDELIAGLATPENQVFPLRFRLNVKIAGENRVRDGVVE